MDCKALNGVPRDNMNPALDNLCFGIQFDGNCHSVTSMVMPIDLGKAGQTVILEICVPIGSLKSTAVFHVNGQSGISLKKPKDFSTNECDFYEARVRIEPSATGTLITQYPNNNIRFALLEYGGLVSVWCFSLVSQNGSFFAVIEETERFQAYWHESLSKVVVPGCKWLEFRALILDEVFADWDQGGDGILPDINEYEEAPPMEFHAATDSQKARVLWYHACMGLGAALLPDGRVARVHWSHIKSPDKTGLRYLEPGNLISYQLIGEPKQTTERTTSFKYELFTIVYKRDGLWIN